ncbi:MAG: hypothetical protein WAN50_00055 [Minisyncoccia bacterium]
MGTPDEVLNGLEAALVTEVLKIRELALQSPRDVTCYFGRDTRDVRPRGTEIVNRVTVDERPERTHAVLEWLAGVISAQVGFVFLDATLNECMVITFNRQKGGYACLKKQT